MSQEKKEIAKHVDHIIKNFYNDNEKHQWAGYFSYYGYFFSRYLEDKYKNVCSWNQDFPIIYMGGGVMSTPKFLDDEKLQGNTKKMNVLKTFIRKCNKRFIVFPVTIFFHQNIVIVDTKANEIELFDSYGNEFEKEVIKNGGIILGGYEMYIDTLKSFFSEIFGYKKYTFYRPVDFFPENREFQNFEINYCKADDYKVNSWGFCVVWSFFYAETRISNPDLSREKCIKHLLNLFDRDVDKLTSVSASRTVSRRRSGKKSNKKETINLYNNNICKLIRGYTLFLSKLDSKTGFFRKMMLFISQNKKVYAKRALIFSVVLFASLAPASPLLFALFRRR